MKYKINLYISIVILFLSLNLVSFAQNKSPNVIIIVADDLGWNDVGYHGSEIKTPMLDQLAREGTELNQFYVHPTCSPTRASLMTGKAAIRLGIADPLYKNSEKGLPLSETILPQYFKQHNYQTWLIGKWHLGRFNKESWPINRGFDHFYGYLTGGIGHYNHVHGGGLDWQRNGNSIREEGYATHLLTHEAITLIEKRNTDSPFFLELCYPTPHLPNEAPIKTIEEYSFIKDKNRAIHAAMITEIDRDVQKLFEVLEKENLLDNSIIIFMSDNGGLSPSAKVKKKHLAVQMAEKWGRPLPVKYYDFVLGNIENGASNNEPFKGGKRSIYEGGIRVPAFIYAPKLLAHKKIDSRITVHDILPTLATALGWQNFNFGELDGVNQWDYLTGKQQNSPNPDFITQSNKNYAFLRDKWKLILPESYSPELYNLLSDPAEEKNLAERHPNIVEELSKTIKDFPKGDLLFMPMEQQIIDPPFFGGKEDRAPWAGFEGRNLHNGKSAQSENFKDIDKNTTRTIPTIFLGIGIFLITALSFILGFKRSC